MKIIVGLGNPAEKYKNNRHNVGFQFIDYLIENLQIPNSKFQIPNKFHPAKGGANFKFQKHLSSIIYHLSSNLILGKTQTFMNQSGIAVKKLLSNFKTLKLSNLIVIHDDLDIPLGKFKIQKGVGPKLHNGIESIEKQLGTKAFWRVRIGVDNRQPEKRIDGETYVLQDFKKEENEILTNQVFPKIFEQLKKNFTRIDF